MTNNTYQKLHAAKWLLTKQIGFREFIGIMIFSDINRFRASIDVKNLSQAIKTDARQREMQSMINTILGKTEAK